MPPPLAPRQNSANHSAAATAKVGGVSSSRQRGTPAGMTIAPTEVLRVGRSTLTFYRGDRLGVLPTVAAHSVGVVVTSPPYNIGVRYRSCGDDLPSADYLSWTARWLGAVQRVMRQDGLAHNTSEHHPLDQVDRHRPRCGRGRVGSVTRRSHKTESIYRRYAIVDEAMRREAAARLDARAQLPQQGRRGVVRSIQSPRR